MTEYCISNSLYLQSLCRTSVFQVHHKMWGVQYTGMQQKMSPKGALTIQNHEEHALEIHVCQGPTLYLRILQINLPIEGKHLIEV